MSGRLKKNEEVSDCNNQMRRMDDRVREVVVARGQ